MPDGGLPSAARRARDCRCCRGCCHTRGTLRAPAGELVNLGQLAVEYYLDHLHPDVVRQVLAPRRARAEPIGALLPAVCAHLRPFPYPYGTLALRILGKLGGRNRHFVSRPMALLADRAAAVAAVEQGLPALAIVCAWRGADPQAGGDDAAGADKADDDDAAAAAMPAAAAAAAARRGRRRRRRRVHGRR